MDQLADTLFKSIMFKIPTYAHQEDIPREVKHDCYNFRIIATFNVQTHR